MSYAPEILNSSQAFAFRRLQAIFARPGGWGPPIAVETQVLLLVELIHKMNGEEDSRCYEVTQCFSDFIHGEGYRTAASLATQMQSESPEAHARIMRLFVASEFPDINWGPC